MSGPFVSESGDVVSSALSVGAEIPASTELYSNFRLELGQIERIYTVDMQDNAPAAGTSIYTVYDVLVTRANGATEIIPRCRMLQPSFGGGINNFFEVLPTDPGAQARDMKLYGNLKRGHYVLVGFVAGHKESGVILGAMPHLSTTASKRRPKKGKGTYLEGEIQGFNFIIDNDGALKIAFNGPRKDDGDLVDSTLGPTTVEINKQGSVTVSTNAKQSVTIDRVSRRIKIANGSTFIDMDQNGDKIQVVAKIVEVGTGALQPAVVGDDLADWLEQLCDEITKIVHPTGVGPSGTPVNSAAFQQLKSSVKKKIQSRLHKVEK